MEHIFSLFVIAVVVALLSAAFMAMEALIIFVEKRCPKAIEKVIEFFSR